MRRRGFDEFNISVMLFDEKKKYHELTKLKREFLFTKLRLEVSEMN